eukprot:scaffold10908_cov105-Isochrysis_galbana.AAC.3
MAFSIALAGLCAELHHSVTTHTTVQAFEVSLWLHQLIADRPSLPVASASAHCELPMPAARCRCAAPASSTACGLRSAGGAAVYCACTRAACCLCLCEGMCADFGGNKYNYYLLLPDA